MFPDADPELLESVTREFIDKLVEILPDLLEDLVSEGSLVNVLATPLVPLFTHKAAGAIGSPLTDQFVLRVNLHLQTRVHAFDPALSTEIKWKSRKRGIRIYMYYLHQPASGYMFHDDIDALETLNPSDDTHVHVKKSRKKKCLVQ